MGSYHSYVGDAKLEDSKDNWYRISGLNVNRINFLVDHGGWNTTKRIPHHGDSLENNVIGYCLSSNNIVSDGYAKICSNFNSTPVAINLLAKVPIIGNTFNIKDRDIDANTLNFPMTHNYNGNIGKSVRRVLVNIVADELWCADLVGNTGGCYTYASSVVNTNSSFRPMLTLKPYDPGITNPIILSCQVRAKCITRPYGWDRTMKLTPLYSVYNIKSIELSLNTDAKGNLIANGNKHPDAVLAGIVPPKADETICVEYKTFEQKDSSNDYNLKVTFDNGRILYVTAALVGTGLSAADQDNTDSRIYRLSDLV